MAVHGMFKSPSKTYIQLKTRDENIKVMLDNYSIIGLSWPLVCIKYSILIKIFFSRWDYLLSWWLLATSS